MVERRPGVMPPKPGPPPRRPPSRQTILARRLVAAVVVVVLLVFGIILARAATRDSKTAPPPITSIAAPKPFRIIFPEGFTRNEMAQRVSAVAAIAQRKSGRRQHIAAKSYRAATAGKRIIPGFDRRRHALEGFLFPATYDFLTPTTSKQLVAKQLAAFRTNWARLDLRYARKRNLTPYDVLIIASMVEKETLAPDERRKVAAVIYNRLKAGMPLGIDATIRYGLDIPPTESIRVSQLESDNPFNTRKFAGLTPTPIANPGLASLQAAAHPAQVDYLYFVRKPDRVHHFFTSSYTEFINYAKAHGY